MNIQKAISVLTAMSRADTATNPDEHERQMALEVAADALRKVVDAPIVEVEVEWNSMGFRISDAPTRRQVEVLDGSRVALVALPPGERR